MNKGILRPAAVRIADAVKGPSIGSIAAVQNA
jgi:hypothetical protein